MPKCGLVEPLIKLSIREIKRKNFLSLSKNVGFIPLLKPNNFLLTRYTHVSWHM